MGEGKYKGEQARLGVGTKKLIVSRQPIFTNLKYNTIKNIANVRGFFESCKPSTYFLLSLTSVVTRCNA